LSTPENQLIRERKTTVKLENRLKAAEAQLKKNVGTVPSLRLLLAYSLPDLLSRMIDMHQRVDLLYYCFRNFLALH
jgi:hypothetical protein